MKKFIQILTVVIVVTMILTLPAAAADIESALKKVNTTSSNSIATVISIITGFSVLGFYSRKNNIYAGITLGFGALLVVIIKNFAWIEALAQSAASTWLS